MSAAKSAGGTNPPPEAGKPEVPPVQTGAERSVEVFARDLPGLLDRHPGDWVAYAHGKQLRVARTQTELYRHCLKELGLRHDEFVVCCIVPDPGGKVETPPR